ncbi:MAG: hypothetical protein P1U40_11355 [Coxiellaceae bacterium]|nr:hypothetical protein [Coxiellaceae bacterium]
MKYSPKKAGDEVIASLRAVEAVDYDGEYQRGERIYLAPEDRRHTYSYSLSVDTTQPVLVFFVPKLLDSCVEMAGDGLARHHLYQPLMDRLHNDNISWVIVDRDVHQTARDMLVNSKVAWLSIVALLKEYGFTVSAAVLSGHCQGGYVALSLACQFGLPVISVSNMFCDTSKVTHKSSCASMFSAAGYLNPAEMPLPKKTMIVVPHRKHYSAVYNLSRRYKQKAEGRGRPFVWVEYKAAKHVDIMSHVIGDRVVSDYIIKCAAEPLGLKQKRLQLKHAGVIDVDTFKPKNMRRLSS